MINRRQFLEVTATAGVGAMIPLSVGRAAGLAATAASRAVFTAPPSPGLAKFVDALPIPGAYAPLAVVNKMPYYEIGIGPISQQLHRDLPPTPLWGYNGTYPGGTIEATVGQPIRVRWRNDLTATQHVLGPNVVDTVNVNGANNGEPLVRVVTHLHGGHVPWTSDGGPEGWYTSGATPITGAKYNGDTFDYPNNQASTTLWYHDHAMGITRLNVYAGLAGFWILRDPAEAALGLPSGKYEIPIVFQDRVFNRDGTLYYPPAPEVPEFFGDTMVVNGKVWPRLTVEPRKYRFRFLNGCNSRFLRMQLVPADVNGKPLSANPKFFTGAPMTQIGTDGGLLAAPVGVNILLMAPAERADLVIDFSQFAGQHFLLYNDAGTPFSNTLSTKGAIPEVMLFSVTAPLSAPDTSVIPAALTTLARINPASANLTRTITLDEVMLPNRMLMQLLNNSLYMDPATETPKLNTTEVWNLLNLTVDTHPIHLHQTMFQIVDRTPFNVAQYAADRVAGTIQPLANYFLGPAVGPDPNEAGWKDTVRANPNEMTRIAMKWMDYDGNYVYHCHILEHEDHEMMRPLIVRRGGPLA